MARIFETFWGKTKIQILRALRCEVVNDLTVGGDAEVAGKISADSGAITDGLIVGGTLECDTIVPSITELSHDLTVTDAAKITATADAGAFDYSLSNADFETSTGDNVLNGNTTIATGKTLTINGDTTITVGKKLIKGTTLAHVLTKTADYVITDTDPDLVFVKDPTDDVIITLPTAVGNTGRTITVTLTSNTGSKSVTLAGSGSDVIYPDSPSSSVAYSAIKVTCDGTGWVITGSSGTWT